MPRYSILLGYAVQYLIYTLLYLWICCYVFQFLLCKLQKCFGCIYCYTV